MKKQILISTSIVAMFSATPVLATELIAFQLGVYDNTNNGCNLCHTNANINTADKGNLMSAAKTAYNQDKFGFSGLKTFLAAVATPTVPTCTNGQVLNATKNGCETPAPVIPTCIAGQVLNAAKNGCETPKPVTPNCTGNTVLNATKDACVALPAPIVTPKPVVDTTTTTPVAATENTKPVLNKVAAQWDATVGETLKIPLSVQDAEQDEFKMLASTLGVKFSAVYTDEKTHLPTVDFLLTPTAKDVNKVLTFTFQAKETKTKLKLMSNKISVRVRVWAAGDRNEAAVKKLNVSTSALKTGKLNLSGAIEFNNLLTTAERKNFIANKFDLTVLTSDGIVLATTPLKLDTKGNWSTTLSVKDLPCEIVLEYQGQKAARSVIGCIASTATITTSTVMAKNDFLNTRFDDDDDHNEHENEHDDHDD